jgi:hypothetical protein
MRITGEDRARLRELTRDLPRLWRAKTTKQEDRKKVVRILIQHVWLDKERNSRTVQIRIHWKTGAVTEGRADWRPPETAAFTTPPAAIERIRQLIAGSNDFAGIAVKLNEEGFKTGKGNEFTGARVGVLVRRRKLRPKLEGDEDQPLNRPSQKI